MTNVPPSPRVDPDAALKRDLLLATLRAEIEAAHRHIQNAQQIVYHDHAPVRRRVPYAINRAQNTLIKLIVHERWPR
jgi:hypothetical protein